MCKWWVQNSSSVARYTWWWWLYLGTIITTSWRRSRNARRISPKFWQTLDQASCTIMSSKMINELIIGHCNTLFTACSSCNDFIIYYLFYLTWFQLGLVELYLGSYSCIAPARSAHHRSLEVLKHLFPTGKTIFEKSTFFSAISYYDNFYIALKCSLSWETLWNQIWNPSK